LPLLLVFDARSNVVQSCCCYVLWEPCAECLEVPVSHVLKTDELLVGLMPYNFITVNAGTLVQELNSMNDVMSRGTIIQLATVSVLFLTSILVKNYLAKQGVIAKGKPE